MTGSKKYLYLGKQVKKLIGQNLSLLEITNLCNSNIDDCLDAYQSYTGKKIFAGFLMLGNKKQKNEIRKLILQNQKVLLFGDIGVGKSSLPRILAQEIGYRIIVSYPTKTEELLKDFAQLPFETKKTLFVIEGDSFYWRSYGLVNQYVKESKCPIIVIVTKKDTVHKTVSKQLVPIKLYPPTKQDVEEFVRDRYPNWNGNIDDVYDKDMHITLRHIKYGITSYKPHIEEKLDAQKVVYKLLQGNATRKDIKNCEHPQLFILNWLGNNAHKFYSNKQKLDDISFVDAYKYNYKKKYLDGVLLSLGKANKRGKMRFPPIKFRPPKKKEDSWEKKKLKRKKIVVKKEPKRVIVSDIGADMIL